MVLFPQNRITVLNLFRRRPLTHRVKIVSELALRNCDEVYACQILYQSVRVCGNDS